MIVDPKNPTNKLSELLKAHLEADTNSEKIERLEELIKATKLEPTLPPDFLLELQKHVDLTLIDKYESRQEESISGGDPAMLTSR